MTLDMRKEWVDFLEANKNRDIAVTGGRGSGKTTMAAFESCLAADRGEKVVVAVLGRESSESFQQCTGGLSNISGWNRCQTSLPVILINIAHKPYLSGLSFDRFIMDCEPRNDLQRVCVDLLCSISKFQSRYLALPSEVVFDLSVAQFSLGERKVEVAQSICPRCSTNLEKKPSSNLFNNDIFEVMKCPKCGYCN